MSFYERLYEDITPERYQVLRGRFDKFIYNLDKDVVPEHVFDPLRESQLEHLRIIREVSLELQQNKDDDILKAKQAAEEASKAEAEAEAEALKQAAEKKEGDEDSNETEKKD